LTDIVNRLRDFRVWNNRQSHYDPVTLCHDAADEIERLRAQNCPCGGWDCTGAPEGPMYGCPYVEAACDHGKLQDGQICPTCGCMGNGEG